MYTKSILSLLLVVVAVVSSQSCDSNGVCTSGRKYCLQPNDCGTLPYGNCSKPVFCLTNPGVAVGSLESGVLYYSEYCSAGATGYTTLNRAYVAGSNPTALATLDSYGSYPIIFGQYQNQVYFKSNNNDPFIYSFSLSSNSINKYPLPAGYSYSTSLTFDGTYYYATVYSPASRYQVIRMTAPLSTTANSAVVIYTLGAQVYGVTVVVGPSNSLFFNSNETVYNYALSTNTATAVYSTGDINNFYYYNDYLYLATSHGLLRYSLSQHNEQQIRPIMDHEGAYFAVTGDVNRLYFNTLYSVRSIDFMGGNNYLVSQAHEGLCVCRPNFSGSDCKTCSGQLQWGDDGYPNCVTRDANGTPVTCSQDYQCGNVPYSICSGNRCTCRPNFTGADCKTCTGQVTWSQDGIPSCNK